MYTNVFFVDGTTTRLTILYSRDGFYIAYHNGDLVIIPHDMVQLLKVDLADFIEAQRAAKEDNLEKVMEEGRKKLAPKHESDGFTWREAI